MMLPNCTNLSPWYVLWLYYILCLYFILCLYYTMSILFYFYTMSILYYVYIILCLYYTMSILCYVYTILCLYYSMSILHTIFISGTRSSTCSLPRRQGFGCRFSDETLFWLEQLDIVLTASLHDIVDRWSEGKGPLAAEYSPEQVSSCLSCLLSVVVSLAYFQ